MACEVMAARPEHIPSLTALLQRSLRGVPFTGPMDASTVRRTLAPTWGEIPSPEPLAGEAAWLAMDEERVVGFCQAALGRSEADHEPAAGLIRMLAFEPERPDVGHAVASAAEAYLRDRGEREIYAFHYEARWPDYHLPHAYLSPVLGHVMALLAARGYGGYQDEATLARPMVMPPQVTPTAVGCGIVHGAHEMEGRNDQLAVARLPDGRDVGLCVWETLADESNLPDAATTLYVRWLHVDPAYRRKGLGAHLLGSAMLEAYRRGHRQATLCCLGDNGGALSLYTTLGFRLVDWTRCLRLDLG
jgi:ribosomal protein S18 acetylase RimI-like enzyme